MLQVRLEKLQFVVEEMQLALFLSKHIDDSFVARTIAVHIVVRAKDFIAHARQLRKPLLQAGINVDEFHSAKEAYAKEYDEYCHRARDKLGAHVQDVEFGERLELWNDIEVVKMEYFADGAREIYSALSSLGIPGYVPYAEPVELGATVTSQAVRLFQRVLDSNATAGVEIATDVLALTRDGTSGLINLSPVHQRAGQIALLHRWIEVWRALLDRLEPWPNLARIIKERLITDIVSSCDCLVTRPVATTAPQAMDGLDKLIVGIGGSADAINSFVSVSKFTADLQRIRVLRDHLGAHLDDDATIAIGALITDIDSYNMAAGLAFYDRVYAAFRKTCRINFALRSYLIDGRRLPGMTAAQAGAVPYGRSAAPRPIAPPGPRAVNDEQEYQRHLILWLDGDDIQRDIARDFFFHAFMESEVVATIQEITSVPAGTITSSHDYRKTHQYLERVLGGLSEQDFRNAMGLLSACRGGDPYTIAELAVRVGGGSSLVRLWAVNKALGEIGSGPHHSVLNFLRRCAMSPNFMVRLEAVLAQFRTYVKVEGQHRVNSRGHISDEFDSVVEPMLQPMADFERLSCLIAIASVLSNPSFLVFQKQFENNYTAVRVRIDNLALPLLKDDAQHNASTLFMKLMDAADYVGASVHLVQNLKAGTADPLHEHLMNACYNRTIMARGDDGAMLNLAMCHLVKKDNLGALSIVDGLASRNPDWVLVHILSAELLVSIPGQEAAAIRRVATVRSTFNLSTAEEARLTAVLTAAGDSAQSSGT